MTGINLPTERKVGHLTLIRQGRKLSLEEYNLLSASEQLDMIHRARGKQKYDLLLNATNAAALTAELHPQELYLTITQLGAEYAIDILSLATPEQISTILDLDCWKDDSLSDVLSLHWLELILSTGEEKICQLARQLEPEIFALFLKKHLTIIRGLEAYDDDDADNAKRLEGIYDINYSSEDAAKIIGSLLKVLQQKEQERFLLIMEMIRSETYTVLEEEVYIERNKRLLDLGFFPINEASEIYSYVAPETFTAGDKTDFELEADDLPSPWAILTLARPGALLAELLTTSSSHELTCELVLLANRKMSADAIDPASAEAVGENLQSVYDTLNLALEFLAGEDISKAEEIFNNTYLLRLFQLGSSLIKQRQTRAKKLLDGPLGPIFDIPEQLLLEALCERPACLFQPAVDDLPGQVRPVLTCRDLDYVDLKLVQITALEQLIRSSLNFSVDELAAAAEQEQRLSTLVLTAVANHLLKEPRHLQPIPVTELGRLKGRTFTSADLHPDFVSKLQQTLRTSTEDCLFFADYCLECWLDDFSAYDPEQLETNLPDCIIIAD